jgi:hypothetical protein
MTRRLSITVPDDLWDAVSHLDDSQSGLVQKALRCLRDTEGAGGNTTRIETEAATDAYYERVLAELAAQARELYEEGYEAVIVALHDSAIFLDWLELITHDYSKNELPRKLSDAADYFLNLRNRHPSGSGEWIERSVTIEEVDEVCRQAQVRYEYGWDEEHYPLLRGAAKIIVTQVEGELASRANGAGVFHLAPGETPSAQVPRSLCDGMAAAIFDTVAAVRRRVLFENAPKPPEGSQT